MPPADADHPRVKGFASDGFDAALKGVSVVSVGPGEATLRLPVREPVQNWVGTLHGGAIATLVGDAGTLAIMCADRDGRPGVTADLNVSYLAAGESGRAVLAHAKVLKAGGNLSFVEVEVTDEEAGTLLAQGRMTKFMGRRPRGGQDAAPAESSAQS